MSLDWNVGSVPNFEERCFVECVDPKKGKHRRLADDTNALIWGTMVVDLGSINRKNINEWVWRMNFCEMIGVSWMERFDDNDNVVGYYPPVESVEDHIGLSTNVVTLTRRKWVTKMMRSFERKVDAATNRQLRDREKELEKND